MSSPGHIVFAGGVSPSYLYPGLAMAAQVAERWPEATVTFVGGGRSVERHAVRAAGFQHANLPSRPAPQNALHAVRFVTDNVAGYWASRWFLKERHVSLVGGLSAVSSRKIWGREVRIAVTAVTAGQRGAERGWPDSLAPQVTDPVACAGRMLELLAP